MSKKMNSKSSKNARAAKSAKTVEPEMPTLVTAMAKLVERMESVERKMDQILGLVSNLPAQARSTASHETQRLQMSSFPQALAPRPSNRVMYQAICADCCKNCEVPFKPGDRPVYCKECFAIRKAGHAPQDPDRRIPAAQRKPSYVPSVFSDKAIPTLASNVSVLTPPKQKTNSKSARHKKKRR